MNSWRLFTFGVVFWDAFENPIFLRETQHEPIWFSWIRHIPQTPRLVRLLAAGMFLLWAILFLYFQNLLILLLLPRFLLMTAAGLTIAPIVVEERVKHSWETLLTMPMSLHDLLLGKVGGALWWLRPIFVVLGAILLPVALGVGFISLALIPTRLPGVEEVPIFILCGGIAVLPAVWTVAFLVDQVQQFLLAVLSAVAMSTSASSTRNAFFSALAAIMIVWGLEVVFIGIVLALQPGRTALISETNLLSLITLGPVVNLVVELNLVQTVFWTACIFVGRELAIYGLWRWAVTQAQDI